MSASLKSSVQNSQESYILPSHNKFETPADPMPLNITLDDEKGSPSFPCNFNDKHALKMTRKPIQFIMKVLRHFSS